MVPSPRLPNALLGLHQFRATGFIRLADSRWPIFLAACGLAVLAAGPAAWPVISVWCIGFALYVYIERRFAPDETRPVWRTYVLRGVVASVCIIASNSLTLLASRAPGTSDAAHQQLMTVFFLIPLFTVIESNNRLLYWGMTAFCATAAAAYLAILGPPRPQWIDPLGVALAICFVGFVIWHFHAVLLSRAVEFEGLWRRLVAIENPRPETELDFFSQLTSLLAEATPERRLSMYLYVPTQRRWKWFNASTRSLDWIESTPALDYVSKNRRSQWAETNVPPKRGHHQTSHCFTAPGAIEGVLVPIALEPAPDGEWPRLRAVLEVPVHRVFSHNSWLWTQWRAERHIFGFPAVRSLLLWLGGTVGPYTTDQLVHLNNERMRQIAPAADGALDSWRQARARYALEVCTREAWKINREDDVVNIAQAIRDYFDCSTAIWLTAPDGQWHLASYAQISEADRALLVCLGAEMLYPAELEALRASDRPTIIEVRPTQEVGRLCLNHGCTHWVVTPIVSRDDVLGSLVLLAARRPQLKERELKLLALVAYQLGLAMGHLRQVVKFKTMAGNVVGVTNLIRDLTRLGGSGSAVQAMHQAVARSARDILSADIVILYGLEPGEDKVVSLWVEGKLKDAKSVWENPLREDSFVFQVARSRQFRFAKNTLEEFYHGRTLNTDGQEVFPVREKIASTFAAPLIFEDKVIGVLFANYHKQREFVHDQGDVYDLFVSLAAHALAISGYHLEWALQGADRDRTRLRGRIHQVVKGQAHSILLNLDALAPLARKDDADYLAYIERSISRAYQSAQDLYEKADQLLDLMDFAGWTDLRNHGLRSLLEHQARSLVVEANRFSFRSNYPAEHPLPIFEEKNLLDFGLEAVLNSVKYARGANIYMALEWHDWGASLVVEDDGPGLLPERIAEYRQAGAFRILREASGGAFEVNIGRNGGLRVGMRVVRH